jgi:hypothetical protein
MQRRQTAKTTAGTAILYVRASNRSDDHARRTEDLLFRPTVRRRAGTTSRVHRRDAGENAKGLRRPGIDALLEHVRRGEIARVAIFKLVQIGNTG